MSKKSDLIDKVLAAGVDVPNPSAITIPQLEELLANAAGPPTKVLARWINSQTMLLRTEEEERIIDYGDTFEVSPERLEADPRLIAADEPWEPDPELVANAEANAALLAGRS